MKTKPIALRRLEGDRGRRGLPAEPSLPPLGVEVPPGLPPAGAALWRELAPSLIGGMGARMVDRAALIALCQSWALMQEAFARVQQEGVTVIGANGEEKKSPELLAWRAGFQHFLALAGRFGLTPVDRARLLAGVGSAAKEAEPGDGILNGEFSRVTARQTNSAEVM